MPEPAQNALLHMAELLAVSNAHPKRKAKPRFMALSASDIEKKIGEGLEDLKSGNVISGKRFAAELKAIRMKKRRAHA